MRGVNGFKTSYDLNINDDTPLHLIAILHHYNATLDDAWVAGLLPLDRENRGLPALAARRERADLLQGQGVDMYGISSWRNIIPYYTLDGAVTEINAEPCSRSRRRRCCARSRAKTPLGTLRRRSVGAARRDDGSIFSTPTRARSS